MHMARIYDYELKRRSVAEKHGLYALHVWTEAPTECGVCGRMPPDNRMNKKGEIVRVWIRQDTC